MQKENKRLIMYDEIFTNAVGYFLSNQKKIVKRRQLIFKNTRDFVIEGQWMVDTAIMENSKETF